MSVQLTAKQERRRKNYLADRRDRRRRAKIAGRQPQRDRNYLEWIRTLDCTYSEHYDPFECSGPIEAAHVGDRGLRQKCSDREAIPLCARHHRTAPGAHHRLGRKFWEHHGLDREALIAAYNAAYEER